MDRKKRLYSVLAGLLAIILMNGILLIPIDAQAQTASIQKGDLTADLDSAALEAAGYQIIDDRDPGICYAWPYTLEPAQQENAAGYGGTQTANLGQVSASLTYHFHGSFLAVAFAETYYAAKIIITVDGTEVGTAVPHNPDGTKDDAAQAGKIVFVKEDLSEGPHTMVITHEAAHTTGEDNIKGDGIAYYDNNAMFDCLIVKTYLPEKLQTGDYIASVSDAFFTEKGYRVVDDRDEAIVYTWPYTLENAREHNQSAYGGTQTVNMGQVSASITYEFSGTYLAVVFAETYYAAKIIITIDGTEAGTAVPHNPAGTRNDAAQFGRVVFVKDDLSDGPHTVVITHEAAHTTGEDNIKGDGIAYYDNNAMFDCFIVKTETAVPTEPAPETNAKTSEPAFSAVLLCLFFAAAIPLCRKSGIRRTVNL